MASKYTVSEVGSAKQLCWEIEDFPTLADLIIAAQTEFPGVPFEELKSSAGEDGYYILLEYGDYLSEVLEEKDSSTNQRHKLEILDISGLFPHNYNPQFIQKSGQ